MEELILNKEAGRWAMLGGCILGGGGGGGAYLGEMLLDKLSEAPPLKLTPMSEVDDDAVVLSVSLVGAPAATEQFINPEAMIRTVELFLANNPGIKLGGIITNENGACATVNGWVQAAFTGLPFLDAQCNGRAHPTGVMGSMGLHRDPNYQTTMAFAGGSPDKGRYVEGVVRGTIDRTSALVRAASVEAGGVVGVARNPVTAAYVRKNGAVGGISQSIALGRACEEGLAQSPRAGVERAAQALKGRVLCQGKVDSFQLRSEGGFDVGVVSVAGHELTFWNEYMTATAPDGTRAATFPDLIMTMDATTGRPVPSANIREGQEVYVIVTNHRNLNLAPTMYDRSLMAPVEKIVDRELLKYQEFND